MKLYEVNEAIERLLEQIEVDEETGEVPENTEEIMKQVDALDMERTSILEYLAKVVLNTRAEAAMIRAEEQRLKARREALGKKEDRLMAILDRECSGKKTSLGVATLSYRKTARIEVSDKNSAIDWMIKNHHTDCYRIAAPEVYKPAVKKLISSGVSVPGCTLVDDYSCSLK